MERSSHLISQLIEEKRKFLRKLEVLKDQKRGFLEEIEAIQKLISSIDTVLLHFDEDLETEEIKAKRKYTQHFPKDNLGRRIIKILKESKETPLPTKNIAELIYGKSDWSNDQYKNIGRSLRGYSELLNIAKEGGNDALWILERYAATETEKEKESSVFILVR